MDHKISVQEFRSMDLLNDFVDAHCPMKIYNIQRYDGKYLLFYRIMKTKNLKFILDMLSQDKIDTQEAIEL